MTVDEKANKVVEAMQKIRLGDLNIYSPKQNADWRVSVNLEIPSEFSWFISLVIGVSFVKGVRGDTKY